MNRLLPRWIGAFWIALCSPSFADIPMVTTPMVLPLAKTIPQLPSPGVPEFSGVTKVAVRSGVDKAQIVDVSAQTDVSAFGVPCEITLDATTRPGAMVGLRVFAPCKPHATVHVSHGGFHLETSVSLTGEGEISFPAMSDVAEVFVAVDEDIFERRLEIEEVQHFARVALVGDGEVAPSLIATVLSKPVDVYQNQDLQMVSVDMRELQTQLTYRLSLRHEITASNCDQPLHTQLRQILPGQAEKNIVLRLAAQDCGRIGDILELKNIVPDLKLVAN